MVRSENKLTATASTTKASTPTAEKLRCSKSNSINKDSNSIDKDSKLAIIKRRTRRVAMVRGENKSKLIV